MKSAVKLEVKEPSEVAGNRSFLAGMLIVIALAAALFYGVAGEDKFLLISPLAVLGYVCLAVWVLRAVFSLYPASVAPPGFFLLLLFTAYGAALGTISTIPYETKLRMLSVGLYVGAYYVWSNSLSLFRRSRAVLGWVILFALLLCFYGLVNHFKSPEQVLWTERYFVYPGRLASTYICPNHIAHLLQMLLPFCLVLTLTPRAGWFLRILSAYCITVYLPTIYFTESRAGMLGSIAALGITICLLALRRSKKLFSLLVILVPLCSFLLLLGAWNYSEMFKRRMTPVVEFISEFQQEGFANAKVTDFRPLTWFDTVEMIKEKPLTGFGPGSFRYVFTEHRSGFRGNRIVTGHPHNEYLEVASEYGLIGLGLLALAWCYGLIRVLVFSLKTQNQHHAFMGMAFIGTAAGTLVHSFFDFQMYIFQNALVFALLAGIAAGPICGRRQEVIMKEGQTGFRNRLIYPAGRVLLALLAVAGLLLSLQLFSSAFLRASADQLVIQGTQERAKERYLQAIKIDSANWRAYKGIGSVYFKERYYTLEPEEKRRLAVVELNYFAQAYKHNPKDAPLVFDYGKATVFLGDTDAGLRLLEEAAGLRPFNDLYWVRLGMEQRKAGRYEEAMESFLYAKARSNSEVARANIAWLEKRQTAAEAAPDKPQVQQQPVAIEPETAPSGKEASLDDLLNLMDVGN